MRPHIVIVALFVKCLCGRGYLRILFRFEAGAHALFIHAMLGLESVHHLLPYIRIVAKTEQVDPSGEVIAHITSHKFPVRPHMHRAAPRVAGGLAMVLENRHVFAVQHDSDGTLMIQTVSSPRHGATDDEA